MTQEQLGGHEPHHLPTQATLNELLSTIKEHGAPGYASTQKFGESWAVPFDLSRDDPDRIFTLTKIEEPAGHDGPRVITNYSMSNIPDGLHLDKKVSVWKAEFFDAAPKNMGFTEEKVESLAAEIDETDSGKKMDDKLGLSTVTEEEARGMIDEINKISSTWKPLGSFSGSITYGATAVPEKGVEKNRNKTQHSIAGRIGNFVRRLS